MMVYGTYNFCFFFGPGLPLGLGRPSGVRAGAPLFEPGLGPGMPFRFTCTGGGARVLDGVLAPPLTGRGVAAESAGVSMGVGSTAGTAGVSVGAEEEGDEVEDGFAEAATL